MSSKDSVYRVIIPEGTHLAHSNNTEGAFRGAVLDDETNQVCGQAELVEVDRDEDGDIEASGDSSGLIDAAIIFGTALLSAGATYAAVRAKPILEKRWHEKWLPALQARSYSLHHSKDTKQLELILRSPEFQQMTPAKISIEIFRAVDEPQSVMTSKEAQARYIAMILGLGIAAEQYRKLKYAQINDAHKQQELQDAFNYIANESVVNLANRVFEANDGLAQEANVLLLTLLEGSIASSDSLLPLKATQVRAMMQLSS
ncbi:hypothetical protein ACSAM2_08100 [Actinomyces oris]|uniref:hypothetical protein n=1 Tax=Actinomyces TaxID=1654 RepID=UPI001269DD0A